MLGLQSSIYCSMKIEQFCGVQKFRNVTLCPETAKLPSSMFLWILFYHETARKLCQDRYFFSLDCVKLSLGATETAGPITCSYCGIAAVGSLSDLPSSRRKLEKWSRNYARKTLHWKIRFILSESVLGLNNRNLVATKIPCTTELYKNHRSNYGQCSKN